MKREFIAAGIFALVVTGCYRHSWIVGNGGNEKAQAAYSSWHSHWVFAIIGEENVDIKRVCPSGNATIKEYTSFLNGLVSMFVGVVYAPTTVEIYCDGGVAQLPLSAEQLRRLATSEELRSEVASLLPNRLAELESARNEKKQIASRAVTNKF